MGKQKKHCWRCNQRRFPPTRNKCEKSELLDSASVSGGANVSEVVRSEVETDSVVINGTPKASQASTSYGCTADADIGAAPKGE